MMLRTLLLCAAGLAAAAIAVPDLAERYLDRGEPRLEAAVGANDLAAAWPDTSRPTGRAVLKANANGHFSGEFLINGRRVQGMVDTGASLVAINLTTANALGIARSSLDFSYSVDTANGKTEAAFVRLRHVQIDGVRVENVGAMVLDDAALSTTLIGMSFLKELSSYQVEGRDMRLTR